jgi:hypothetical protein
VRPYLKNKRTRGVVQVVKGKALSSVPVLQKYKNKTKKQANTKKPT